MNNEKRLWNLTELEAFGYHRSTIRKKLKAAGIEPVAYKGQTPLYDIVQVIPYLVQAPRKESDAPDLMGFKTAAEFRAYIQAQAEKLKFMKDTEEVVDVADYEGELGRCIAAIKSFKNTAIVRVETAIANITPQQLEDLERLFNFDLEAVANEFEQV
ncbi:hypothetical protein [Vibrio sp. TRT 17S01]|uniref:hypothetical protein n=1 Tax=Vibrio sp. TRT 17S01 TaxID=3418505 RepID=UPI003CF4A602